MRIVYVIEPNENLIIEKIYGEVSVAGMLSGMQSIWNHKDYSPSYNGIIDLREGKIMFGMKELGDLIEGIQSNEKQMWSKAAILVSEPLAAALATFYGEKAKGVHSSHIMCSESEVESYLAVNPNVFDILNSDKALEIEV